MLKPTLLLTTLTLSAFALSAELKCPVTKFAIPKKENAVGKATYKGKTYYFCTSHCQALFKKNPQKYAK